VKYFDLMTPENNQGRRLRWFYIKDYPIAGHEFELEEFRAVSDQRARQSWDHPMKKEDMIATELLMLKIQELRSTPGREMIGIQLVGLFIERRVHPISASACRL
jgi:hypothetical protein